MTESIDARLYHGARRRADIIATGIEMMAGDNPAGVSARSIGKVLGITHSAVLYHFGNSAALMDEIAAEAVRSGNRRAVAYLIGIRHKAVAGLSDMERAGYVVSQ